MQKYLILSIFILSFLTSCKPKTYTVTLILDDNKFQSFDVIKGNNVKDLEIPTKDGYIFVSWLKDGIDYDITKKINEDIKLTANWIKEPDLNNLCTITFDFGEYQKNMSINCHDKITKPKDPEKDKYQFLGWYYQDTLYDFNSEVDKDITLTAKYRKTRINITYDLNKGSGITSTEIDYGSIPKIPHPPTKYGYKFIKWVIGDTDYLFNAPLYEDTTITAIWEARVYYMVTFDTDGGSFIHSEIIEKGNSLKSITNPTKNGYTFKYWSLNGIPFDINDEITDNITLKAIYEFIDN